MDRVSADSGIVEWLPADTYHNLGDHLAWLIGERIFTSNAWLALKQAKSRRYVLIGSFLCDYNLQGLLNADYVPVLIGCGYRGESLSAELIKKTLIYGCRGRLTAQALNDVGIKVRPIGDPAMILPLLVQKGNSSGQTLLVPHIGDDKRHSLKAGDAGVDQLVQPETESIDSLISLVQKISSATFVLAGAMHAAIIAHAYGVPFAFYARQGEHLDCPPKWKDWISSISSGEVPTMFFDNIKDGKDWHKKYKVLMHRNRYIPILREYFKVGAISPRLFVRALLSDFDPKNRRLGLD